MSQLQIPKSATLGGDVTRQFQVPKGSFVNYRSTVVAPPSEGKRALVMVLGSLSQITPAQVGTGLKPLVLYQGALRQRLASEGVPVVLDQGQLRTLATSETLII